MTVRLAFFPAKAIRQILSGTAGAVLFSVLILLPSVFMGTPQTLMNITSRVYVSVTLVGILSSGTSWNKLTGSMRTFFAAIYIYFYAGYYFEIYFDAWRDMCSYSYVCPVKVSGKELRKQKLCQVCWESHF